MANEKAAIAKPFNGWKASAVDVCVKATKREEHRTPDAELREECQRDAEPMAVDVLAHERVADFSKKEKALDAYIQSLQTIATGHQHLYDHLDELDKDSVIAQIKSYSKTIQTLRKAIITLSK